MSTTPCRRNILWVALLFLGMTVGMTAGCAREEPPAMPKYDAEAVKKEQEELNRQRQLERKK